MNDRARAIDILKRARDLLAQRLTDSVLEWEEELLDDARGLSYMNEIDTLHEQIGARLVHISQLLAGLPAESSAPAGSGYAEGEEGDWDHDDWRPIDVGPEPHALHEAAVGQTLVLPPPSTTSSSTDLAPQPISLQTFAAQIQFGGVEAAARSLELIFECSAETAMRCTRRFFDNYIVDPTSLVKVLRLRSAIRRTSFNEALSLLNDCFGLSGVESVAVLHRLRRLAAS